MVGLSWKKKEVYKYEVFKTDPESFQLDNNFLEYKTLHKEPREGKRDKNN